MICIMSPYTFVFCYQLAIAYVVGLSVKQQMCIEVIDNKEYIRPRFMINSQSHEFYACGHAFEVIGVYR